MTIHILQTAAACERLAADGGHTVGDGDARQTATAIVPKYADWFDAFDALEEHLSNLPAK